MFNYVHARQYRGFRDKVELRLGRITALFGVNNAGKSAAARLLPILASAVSHPGGGLVHLLPSDSPFLRGSSIRSLEWRGDLDDGVERSLHFEIGAGAVQASWSLRWVPELRRFVVSEFVVQRGAERITGSWIVERTQITGLSEPRLEYQLNERVLALRFDGLVPFAAGQDVLDRTSFGVLSELSSTVRWIGPVRASPGEIFSIVEEPGPVCDDGAEAAKWVFHDRSLRERVSEVLQRVSGYAVDAEGIGDQHGRLFLIGRKGGEILSFNDMGEGVQQVFAVVVALERLRQRQSGVLVVEEPGSHLHPKAQAILAEHLVDVVKTNPGIRVVVETHSEIILTGLQRAVVAESLEAVEVSVYWVDQDDTMASRLIEVPMDRLARFERPVFADAFSFLGDQRRQLLAERRAVVED